MNRLDFAIRTTNSRKKYGQFFTSKEIAVFMAELFEIPNEYQMLSILDSGTGSEILSVALYSLASIWHAGNQPRKYPMRLFQTTIFQSKRLTIT